MRHYKPGAAEPMTLEQARNVNVMPWAVHHYPPSYLGVAYVTWRNGNGRDCVAIDWQFQRWFRDCKPNYPVPAKTGEVEFFPWCVVIGVADAYHADPLVTWWNVDYGPEFPAYHGEVDRDQYPEW